MKYLLIPTEDLKSIFTDEEISNMRKSVDELETIVHEEIVIKRGKELGISWLSVDTEIDWPYVVYEYGSKELNDLLSSEEWIKQFIKN